MLRELLYYIEGLDDSIFKLNSYISDNGFEFTPLDIIQFEEKFRDLFPLRKDYYEDKSSGLPTLSFINGLWNSRYFNHWEIRKNNYVIFLNDKSLYKSMYDENIAEKDKLTDNVDNEVNELIKKLKLLKRGHIKLLSSFEFKTDDQGTLRCNPVSYSSPLAKNKINKEYHLDNNNIAEFQTLKIPEPISSYLELAFNSFLESYNIENEKLKFVMLMVCLESIYNINGKYIKHNISKYAALTIMQDNQVLNTIVEKIQALYELRNFIVHGDNENIDENDEYKKQLENISQYILDLEEIVRKVLKELILNKEYSEINEKKELFNCLNAKGFLE